MGLLKNMRERRVEKKAQIKAAKSKALAEAKASAKLEKAKEKYLRKTAKQVRKTNQKELKARRAHEEKLAKVALEQIKAGNFNGGNVARYLGGARVALPVALPLIYRGLAQLQGAEDKNAAHAAGVAASDMAQFAGDGAPQKARIKAIRTDVGKGGLPIGFAKDVIDRLDEIVEAVNNTANMNNSQTKGALKATSRELGLIEAQIAAKRG